MKLTLGFSPCPNDTFIFDALIHHKVDTEGLDFDVYIADVEELNLMARENRIEATKLSYHAYLHVAQDYLLCKAGSALGRGNGPLLVSRRKIYPDEVADARIAIPGRYTTAAFLLKFAYPNIPEPSCYLFSDIAEVVMTGEADAGVLIHEGRFTYAKQGLRLINDLGQHWEQQTAQAVPLGGIAVSRSIPDNVQQTFSRALSRSVKFAMENPQESYSFVRKHAQEQEENITRQHINLFVNWHTLDLGEDGMAAVNYFMDESKRLNVVKELPEQLFVHDR